MVENTVCHQEKETSITLVTIEPFDDTGVSNIARNVKFLLKYFRRNVSSSGAFIAFTPCRRNIWLLFQFKRTGILPTVGLILFNASVFMHLWLYEVIQVSNVPIV